MASRLEVMASAIRCLTVRSRFCGKGSLPLLAEGGRFRAASAGVFDSTSLSTHPSKAHSDIVFILSAYRMTAGLPRTPCADVLDSS